MDSLYYDGDDWILNGSVCPSGIYMLGQDGNYVTILGVQTGERLEAFTEVTQIDKNATGDKYQDMAEFRKATQLFFEKNQSSDGYKPIHGQTTGYSVIDKFGANPLITTGSDPEDVVQQGGIQRLADWGTAPIIYMSTSDAGNTQKIEVTGLDINGDAVTQEVICDGQNNVNLSTPLYRLFTAETNDTTTFAGTVYFHDDPTPTNGVPTTVSIFGIVTEPNQRTLIASYTVPKGKVGYLYRGELGIEKTGGPSAVAEYARFLYLSRRLGKVFTSKKRITVMVAQGAYQDVRTFPDIIPALTDIKIQVEEVSADIGAWATMDIRLVDESKFSQAFLTAIGQPQ